MNIKSPLLLNTHITTSNNQRAGSVGEFQASDQRSKCSCPNADALHTCKFNVIHGKTYVIRLQVTKGTNECDQTGRP